MSKDLFNKYDIPAPRYTSYPTVPYWSNAPTKQEWMSSVRKHLTKSGASWSLYLHIPFCESLCTFCGCNTSITKNHKHEQPYVQTVLKEFEIYKNTLQTDLTGTPLRHLHLGGGTPTFLSAENLKLLLQPIMDALRIDANDFEGSIEVDPRHTNEEQLRVLRGLGFNRLSMGIQDFDGRVQTIVNRVQSYALVKELTEIARQLGFESVNYDLIYGLPLQTRETIKDLADKTVALGPDRIALYSFALVPWIKPAQRLFKDEDVPTGQSKRELYELARDILLENGYVEIGMDHFARPSDALSKAQELKRLHRNFMGYSDKKTDLLLGLGVSSISETSDCFHQNEKRLPVYTRQIEAGGIATLRGHLLNGDDCYWRQKILDFMTTYEVELDDPRLFKDIKDYLSTMEQDGLVAFDGLTMYLTEAGKPFLRNACMALDRRLRDKTPDRQVFSQSL